ncbi:SMI1/KNR4 family protein [Actinospica sp. MGRD01-02]|uniref:SMI1/KNR4 family protein n=1 Tax=Actinospica acidithermotolerans TaxID=2828514 RepID=A0A941IM49_9ACTN|nr:SMI1/KNR4 family protein [Actinospica acidithermotolerans]MBR7830697.1 SMI1/KNR4 family protein [Actinospica acidithermotolerans]
MSGRIGRGSWSVPFKRVRPQPGRALLVEDRQAEFDAVKRIHAALDEDGRHDIAFTAEISSSGRSVLYLFSFGGAVERGIGVYPGALVLADGAVAEPWRRLPAPAPGATAAASADPALLERTLRDRLPDAVGAGEDEIAAAQARLGIELPEELKVLYRVTRARWEDWDEGGAGEDELVDAVGCRLFDLDHVSVADASSRPCPWQFAAVKAAVTPPGAAVQGLAGSPGWIVFGCNYGGDQLAVDLTPGPGGHTGQVIFLSHEENVGAELLADSLTDFVLGRKVEASSAERELEAPVVARVNVKSLQSTEAAAHPGLEVLSIGAWDGEPLSLAPVFGLPRLRTLTAYPGTLADPLEIASLTALEYLEIGLEEWRALLDAGAVPRGLAACGIEVRYRQHPVPVVALANELLALWNRPTIGQIILEGQLASS